MSHGSGSNGVRMAYVGEVHSSDLETLVSSISLPEDFAFGVATAGYQNEGGFNGPGEPMNNWSDWESVGKVEASGKAVMFWEEPDLHVERAAALGIDSFRLSIEWARIFPVTRRAISGPPEPDYSAVLRYADIVQSLRSKGMEPLVTLHHFTHPRWLGLDAWSRDSTIDRYVEYVSYSLDSLNGVLVERGSAPIKRIVTFNEPNGLVAATYLVGMFPPGYVGRLRAAVRSLDCLMAAHVKAYNAIHDLYEFKGWDPPEVSTNVFFNWTWPLSQCVIDLLVAREAGVPPNHSDLLAYVRDSIWRFHLAARSDPLRPRGVAGLVEEALHRSWPLVTPKRMPLWMEALYSAKRASCLDYISLDYYDPFLGNGLRRPFRNTGPYTQWSPVVRLWEQRFNPAGLTRAVEAACQNAPEKPVVVAENGMCSPTVHGLSYGRPDGITRDTFIKRHLAQIFPILANGVHLKGYYHWTLFDNYEWGSYTPRFGIYGVDRTVDPPSILETDAMGIDAAKAFRETIEAIRSEDPTAVVEVLLS